MKYNNITINQLRTFTVVARHGSFNRAAEELARTQPAVTMAIKQLESYVGLKLFERSTRQVTPSSAGEKFLPVAVRLVREFDSAIYDVTSAAEFRSGHVSMTVLPSIATCVLPAAVAAFTGAFPEISLQSSDTNARGVQLGVERNEVDFGIGGLWQPSQHLKFIPFLEDAFEFVCHRDHPFARERSSLEWSELGGLSFLASGLTQDLNIRKYVGNPKFEFSTMMTLFAMLKANIGVTVLPALAVPQAQELVSIPLVNSVETRKIFVIVRDGWVLSPAAKAMLQVLSEVVVSEDSLRKRVVKSYKLDFLS